MDEPQYIRQLKQRHSSIAWWVRMMRDHPYGVVPIPTAARMLSVTPNRIRALIDEGRLSIVEGMPGSNNRDRFIPVDQLIDAPFAMTRGRPGEFGPEKRFTKEYLENSEKAEGYRKARQGNKLMKKLLNLT